MYNFAVHLKLTQHCKLTLLQFFKMVFKKLSRQEMLRVIAVEGGWEEEWDQFKR